MSLAPEYFISDNQTGADANIVPGSDTNDGLTHSTPKRTYQNVMSSMWNTIPAGGIVNFVRGGGFVQNNFARMTNNNSHSIVQSITRSGTTFTAKFFKRTNAEVGDSWWHTGATDSDFNGFITLTAVSDANPYTVSWEGNAGAATSAVAITNSKLRFDGGSITVKDYTTTVNPPSIDAMPYCEYKDSVNRQHMFDNGNPLEGVIFKNISYKYTGAIFDVDGCFFTASNARDSFIFDNLIIDGYRIAINPSAELGEQTFFNITNTTIRNCWGGGILGAPSDSVMSNVTFINNGHNNGNGGNQFNHNLYYSNRANMRDNVVRFCTFYQSSRNAAGQAAGSSISVHGRGLRLTFEDLLVYEDLGFSSSGNWLISVAPGYTNFAEDYTDTIIRRCRFINGGNRDIDIAGWVNGEIENNLIINNQTGFTSVISVYCRFSNVTGPAGAENQNVTIRNNTIFGSNMRRVFGLEFGTGFNCVSNIVSYTGTGVFSMFECALSITTNTNYANIDNNLAYAPNASTANWEETRGSLTAWQTANGNLFDMNSIEGQDPLFIDPSNANNAAINFKLQAGSPALGSGHPTLSSPTGWDGNSRGANPDMGIYQFTTGAPPPASRIKGVVQIKGIHCKGMNC